MKYFLKLLFIITNLFIPHLSFSVELNFQNSSTFGNDVIAHDDINYNDQISDLAVAFNGWIYIVTASRHTSPSGAGLTFVVSKDSGVTWNDLGSSTGAHNNIDDINILVTGNDTNSLRIYVAVLGNDIGNPYETGAVYVFDGMTGTYLPTLILNLTNFLCPITGISLASDYLHPASGTIGYSVAILYSTGLGSGTSTDSLVCLLSIDTSSSHYNYYLVDTGYLGTPSIGYGISQSNSGKYYVTYTGQYGIEYCRNISTITSGFTPPIDISALTGILSLGVSNPKIVCQNSLANNDSSGLSVAIIVEKATGSANNEHLEIMYNMQAAISNYWIAGSVDDSAGLGLSGEFDAYFSPENNLLYACGFNDISGKLWARAENFNFENSNHWINLSDQYNDTFIDISITNYLHPHPKASAIGNRFISSWSSIRPTIYPFPGGYPHYMRTLFDKSDSVVVTNVGITLKNNLFKIYPVPADDYLTIDISANPVDNSIGIQLLDMEGKILFDKSGFSSNKFMLNTSVFKNGIYLLKIYSNTYLETQRVVICHHDQ